MLRDLSPPAGVGSSVLLFTLLLCAGIAAVVMAAVGELPMWSTIDGGGGTLTGGGFRLLGAAGQADAGLLTGRGFTLHGGYIGGGSTATSVGEPNEPPPGTVAVFRFHPVTPNPFNPVTSIAFDLPTPERVSLRIYNLRGNLVRTLLEQEMPAGSHQIRWRGDDLSGHAVASGVYLVSFDAGTHHVRRKVTLVR
jgi:hypothetical protein